MKMMMKLAMATISGILLFGSMNLTTEAATSRSISDITLKSAAAKPKAMSEGEKLEKAEQERIEKLLEKNPDDTYMVYISNEVAKQKKAMVYSMGNPFPKFDTYEGYQKKASTLKDTVLQQPVDLPEGYQFVSAQIGGPYSTHYAKEMEAEAKKLGKKIYSKKINWTSANAIEIEYASGKHKLKLGFSRLDPKQPVKQQGYVYESAEEMRKNSPKLGEENINNILLWAEKGKQFSIVTNPGNPLTKEDLIKLAKTMVKK